ncbi:MAG: cycloisomerase, partial [Methylobacteriaceae bacterium]|nr:cycloisomerase [Methylobacteriaceae bacterium]
EANQGIAVDDKYFYAIDNTTIGKYEKDTGKFVEKWEKSKEYPAIHFDGGVVLDGKLYLPHSNYSASPMTSSVEIFDAETLKPIGTHSFGIKLGSLTWVDRHDGAWWAVFANYNRVFGTNKEVYGHTWWTVFVKMNDNWEVQQSWIFPDAILKRSDPMSVSGGSWGPDGRLYVTGHDHPEAYVVRIPKMGSILELEETIPLNIEGQGIAWDRSKPGTIYGISRKNKEVVVSTLK